MDFLASLLSGASAIVPKVLGGMKTSEAADAAQGNLDYQKMLLGSTQYNQLQNFLSQIAQLRDISGNREATARELVRRAYDFTPERVGGPINATRVDQFGNTLSYDPTTNTWKTTLSPQQQALLSGVQRLQAGTVARGDQAAADYQRVREAQAAAGTPSEARAQQEILDLIQQARGEGDRGLAKYISRQDLRQAGNMPAIHTGNILSSLPGQRLAEDMLKARQAATSETAQRAAAQKTEFYDPMAQFERTANTAPQSTDIGAAITAQLPGAVTTQQQAQLEADKANQAAGMTTQQARLAAIKNLIDTFSQTAAEQNPAYSGYGQALGTTGIGGGRNVDTAQANITTAAKNFASAISGGSGSKTDALGSIAKLIGGGGGGGTSVNDAFAPGTTFGKASGPFQDPDASPATPPPSYGTVGGSGKVYADPTAFNPGDQPYSWLDTVPGARGQEAGYNWKF